MLAKVREIQVNGYYICRNIRDACKKLLADDGSLEKLNIAVILKDGSVKHLTIRQEDDCIYAYGDFAGLPDFLEYAQERDTPKQEREAKNATPSK